MLKRPGLLVAATTAALAHEALLLSRTEQPSATEALRLLRAELQRRAARDAALPAKPEVALALASDVATIFCAAPSIAVAEAESAWLKRLLRAAQGAAQHTASAGQPWRPLRALQLLWAAHEAGCLSDVPQCVWATVHVQQASAEGWDWPRAATPAELSQLAQLPAEARKQGVTAPQMPAAFAAELLAAIAAAAVEGQLDLSPELAALSLAVCKGAALPKRGGSQLFSAAAEALSAGQLSWVDTKACLQVFVSQERELPVGTVAAVLQRLQKAAATGEGPDDGTAAQVGQAGRGEACRSSIARGMLGCSSHSLCL